MSDGVCVEQCASAVRQRGWKWQPGDTAFATEKAYGMPVHTYVNRYAFTKTLEFKTYPDELPRFYYAKWK